MKKLYLSLAFISLFVANRSAAQELLIDSVNQSTFQGIYKADEMGNMNYTFYRKAGDPSKLIVRFLDPSFRDMPGVEVEVPSSYKVISSVFNGQNYLFVFRNDKNKNVYISFEQNGTILKKVEMPAANSRLITTPSPDMYAEMLMTSKSDYELRILDKELNVTSSKKYSANKGSWEVVNVLPSMDKTFIVRKEGGNDNFKYTLNAISENGESVFENKVIGNEEYNGYPTFISMNEGGLSVGGYYYTGNKYSDVPIGVFLSKYSPDGDLETTVTIPYSQVIEGIEDGDLKTALANNEDKLYIVSSYQKMDDPPGFGLIGEVFSVKETADKSISFTKKQLLAITFDMESKFQSVKVIEVPQTTAKIYSVNRKTVNDMDLANYMKENHFLSYRFTPMHSPVPAVFYSYQPKESDFTVLAVKPLSSDTTMLPPRTFELNRNPGPKNDQAKSPSFTYPNIVTPTTGAYLQGPNEIMFYDLRNSRLMLWKDQVAAH